MECSGTVEARVMKVGSRVGGRVKEVVAREGEIVKEGQPLVVLETGDLEAQKLMAQGQVDQAQAALDKLEKGARPEEIEQAKARALQATAGLQEARAGARSEEIAGARARLNAAQATLDKAQSDSERSLKLLAAQAISHAEADSAELGLKSALANRDAQKHALDELLNGVRQEEIAQAQARATEAQANAKLVTSGARVEDIRAARGVVTAAKGRLDQITTMIDELTIRAPRAGRIESLSLRPGDIIAPSSTAATVLEEDQLYVRIYVPETRLGVVHVGDEMRIRVDTWPNRSFEGKIEHIASVGEYTPRNLQTADERANQVFAVRVGLIEGRQDLRAGMAALMDLPAP
jgi:multidrug resistance efflux pump